jgi:hypothetical protein
MATDDSVEAAIHRAIRALEDSGIPYMLTGSFARSFHGAPRTTQDLDRVIDPSSESLERLLEQFPADLYYVNRFAALQAYDDKSLFNVIDLRSGWKIDFICRKTRPFSIREFERRQRAEFQKMSLYIATAEDVVLSKLEWAKMGGSERQIEDVAGILRTQREVLDIAYLEHWVSALGVSTQWVAARERALSSQT